METTNRKRSVIVGIFIAIGIVIFMVGIFTLGGQQKAFVQSTKAIAVFDDVSGLQQGNNIWFSGVKVGTVKKIEFYNSSQVKVTLHIEDKAREFIRSDAKAKISTDGLIGNKIIVLYGGTDGAPPIEDGDTIGVEKALSTDDMMATLQENNMNLIDITRDLKVISKQLVEGKGTLGALLNEKVLYNDLKTVVKSLQVAANNSQQLTASVAAYTAQLQTPGTLAADLVSDTAIIPNLRMASGQLNAASSAALTLAGNLKEATRNLNDSNNTVGVLLHDTSVAADIKTIMENLNSGSKKLDENLEALQHNFLLRGFFRKKAKREARAAKDSVKAAEQDLKNN